MFNKKKKRKEITRKYTLNLNDYEQNCMINFVIEKILSIKEQMYNTTSAIALERLIEEKYAFMKLSVQLGFNIYLEELENRKPVHQEVFNYMQGDIAHENTEDEQVEETSEETEPGVVEI